MSVHKLGVQSEALGIGAGRLSCSGTPKRLVNDELSAVEGSDRTGRMGKRCSQRMRLRPLRAIDERCFRCRHSARSLLPSNLPQRFDTDVRTSLVRGQHSLQAGISSCASWNSGVVGHAGRCSPDKCQIKCSWLPTQAPKRPVLSPGRW